MMGIMTATTPPHNDGPDVLDVVVNADGGVTIPAAELARRGIRPGMHLRVVPAQREAPRRRSARGLFADRVAPGELDQFVDAMAQAKAERVAALVGDQV
jgi:hypothetical protein